MDATSWQKIKDLFALALDQPRERRQLFVRQACGDDPDLSAEVESLLEAHDQTEQLIERSDYGISSIFDGATEAYEGKAFGSYKVVREIGRGGMGTVFLAERSDGEFKQQVALKVVRRSFADSELARRFRRERQILASLNHPNIARLLDGGVSSDGEPFLVMEYVEGVRIDNYCEEHKLSTNKRLRLFLTVCAGISYAHQNLVVHRDVKPSNVLVTADVTPHLLDFGIAKLLDAEHADEHTETSFRAFTPDYASPEQMRGEQITTASDVYSLGVLLQVLLSGAPNSQNVEPAIGMWRSESSEQKTVATNLATNPENGEKRAKPSNRRIVNAELKNIIAMAKRQEPVRRYASVAQFAEDIQRYLDGLPVRAQKDSFTYRTGKFIRRNKVSVGAAAIVMLSLIAGLALALWQASIARRERDRAERRFSDVRQLSNALLTDIAPKIERLQGATEARQSLLFQSLKYLDSLAQEAEGDLALQAELAAAYEKIGDLQGNPANPNFVDTEAALKSYEKARAIRLKLLEKTPSDFEQRRKLAENHRVSGNIYAGVNDFQTELKNLETASGIYEKLLAENPASKELRFAQAKLNYNFGRNYANTHKYSDAFPYLQRAIDALENLRRENSNQTDVIKLLGDCRTQLSNALSWEGKQTEAEAEAARAIELLNAAVANNPNDVSLRAGLLNAYWLTSNTYEEQNNRLSHEYALKAFKVIEEIVKQDPANIWAKQQLSKSFSALGQTSINIGKPQEATLYLEKASEILREITESRTKNNGLKTDLAAILMVLGAAKSKKEDFRDALADFQQAADIQLEILQNLPSDTRTKRNLAMTYEGTAETHEKIAEQESGEKSLAARASAKNYYQRTLDILLQLEVNNMLSEYDREFLENTKKTLQKFE